MAQERRKVEASIPQHLYNKLKLESDTLGVSMAALITIALATRYEGELVSPNHVNHVLEDSRLKDEENG